MLYGQHNLPHAHNLNPFFNFMHLLNPLLKIKCHHWATNLVLNTQS